MEMYGKWLTGKIWLCDAGGGTLTENIRFAVRKNRKRTAGETDHV